MPSKQPKRKRAERTEAAPAPQNDFPASERPKQKTRPKKGKPVEIPVPKRIAFDKLLKKASTPKAPRE